MNLLVVESKAKARTIRKYLRKDLSVLATRGHVQQFPSRGHTFGANRAGQLPQPPWEWTDNGVQAVRVIRNASKQHNVTRIFLGSDPDREGEFIAWRLSVVYASSSAATMSLVVPRQGENSGRRYSLHPPAGIIRSRTKPKTCSNSMKVRRELECPSSDAKTTIRIDNPASVRTTRGMVGHLVAVICVEEGAKSGRGRRRHPPPGQGVPGGGRTGHRQQRVRRDDPRAAEECADRDALDDLRAADAAGVGHPHHGQGVLYLRPDAPIVLTSNSHDCW